AYARLVGLNASEVGRIYKEQAYAFEVGRVRDDSRPLEPSGRSQRTGSRSARGERPREERAPRQNAFGRTLYDDRTDERGRTYATDRVHPTRHGAVPTTQYTNLYAAPKAVQERSKLPFIIGGAIIIVLLAIVLFQASCSRGPAQQDVPDVPITGLTDTSSQTTGTATGTASGDGSDASGTATTTPAAVAPTSAKFSYQVKDGQKAYIEVYLDGSSGADVAQNVDGPATKDYNVTGTLRFVTSNPDGVTLTLDGQEVEPVDTRGNGVYTYTVDFPAILQDWQDEHAPATGDDAGSDAGDSGSTTAS
ncbi:MAG: helix-turn-helix domain-containing protein, partial [Eggerthellaceae bacterium]|nr:helix-turn-helix domain-containing protein [Eggerthellaceae bacterium]